MRKSSRIILWISVISVGIGLYIFRNADIATAKFAIDNSNNLLISKGNLFLIGIVPFIVVFTMDLGATLEAEQLRPFIKYYDHLKYVICIAFQLLYILIVIGQFIDFNEKYISGILFAIVILFTGYTMPHIHQNDVIGIKNKWTLNNKIVWDKVHLRCSTILYGIGVITLILTFTSHYILIIVLIVLNVIAYLYLRYYSYQLSIRYN